MMKFTGICLVTDDVQALTAFYTRVLDVEAIGDEVHVELNTTGASIAIFSSEGMEEMAPGSMQGGGNGRVTLGFEVADLDAAYDQLKSLEATFIMHPTQHPWGLRSTWFRDPDGNIVNFYSSI